MRTGTPVGRWVTTRPGAGSFNEAGPMRTGTRSVKGRMPHGRKSFNEAGPMRTGTRVGS